MTREFCFDDTVFSGVGEYYVGTRREILSLCNHLDKDHDCWCYSGLLEANPYSMFGCEIGKNSYNVWGSTTVLRLITEVKTVVVEIGEKKFRFTGNARQAKGFIEAKRQECEALYGFGWWNYFTVEV